MKKTLSLVLAIALVWSLAGCASRDAASPAAAPEAAPTAAVAVSTGTPEPTATPEPTPEPLKKVYVSVESEREDAYAEDGQLLLSFSCDTPVVTMPGRESVAIAVNQVLREDARLFREGTGQMDEGNISGREGYLYGATEDRAVTAENGFGDIWCCFALERNVKRVCGNGRVLSVVYEDYMNSGGAHGYTGHYARSFDLSTGEELTPEIMAVDPAGISDTLTAMLLEQSRSEVYAMYGFFDGYEEYMSNLVMPGCWHMNKEGLVFLADAYLLAPYAAGTIEFTVPYESLKGILKDEYLPETEPADGTLEAAFASDGNIVLSADDGTDGQGAQILLTARGTVRDVVVERVRYWESTEPENDYYTEGIRCLANVLTDGESISLLTFIPDVMPSLRVSYRAADGVHSFLISQSGEDGSLILI